jgi:hypothetical protein
MVFCVQCGTKLTGPYCSKCGTKSMTYTQIQHPDPDITHDEILGIIHPDYEFEDEKYEAFKDRDVFHLTHPSKHVDSPSEQKESNENTLKVYDKDGDMILLKVEDGSIKIGYHNIVFPDDLTWDTPSEICVKYPYASQKCPKYIEIKYTFENEPSTWFIKYEYIEKINNFFIKLVSADKLVSSVTRGAGTKYTATAQRMTGGFTNLKGGTRQYMGQFNPYLLHKTGRP